MGEASVWLIAGPTASGKSSLALALAEATGAEIVNADSMQVYADLSVLTARPGDGDLVRAPHHLYGMADGAEIWSVGRWLRAAEAVLAEIAARARPSIVVGGTGLYFRALTQGLADIPPVPDAVRAEVQASYELEGEDAFRRRLASVDPAAAARIESGDRQRLVRAMSVAAFTGSALSAWQQGGAAPVVGAWRGLVLDPPRANLYDRCDARLGAMLEEDGVGEVERLLGRSLAPTLPVMKALGVPELAAYLRGETSLDDALALARQATRRYAKRQSTWFRNQTPDWPRLAAPDVEAAHSLLTMPG